jgi:hypothetical protein
VARGDSHYARPEAMAWCERRRVGYIFGLAGNAVLLRRVGDLAEDAALGQLIETIEELRLKGIGFRSHSSAQSAPRENGCPPARDSLPCGCAHLRAPLTSVRLRPTFPGFPAPPGIFWTADQIVLDIAVVGPDRRVRRVRNGAMRKRSRFS